MKIREYKALTPGRIVIYGGILLAFLLAGILAARAPDDALPADVPEVVARGLPWLGHAISLAIVAVLVRARVRYGRQIAWYTKQGVAILPGDARAWLEERKQRLEDNIEQAWRWWAIRHPDELDRLAEALNGCHLAVIVQDGPLRDPRLKYPAKGLAERGKIRLWFPSTTDLVEDAYLKGFEGRELDEVFFAYLRHEVAHVCLYALGMADDLEAHHKQMKAEGCPDS
jgi:hypothetical protein